MKKIKFWDVKTNENVKFINLESVKEFKKKKSHNIVSYSQFQMYSACLRKWELRYIKKYKISEPSIHLVFGTSMHEVLQTYLKLMYTESIKKADELNLNDLLQKQLVKNYQHDLSKNAHFSTTQQMTEFYEDGVAILDWFKRRRGTYFNRKGYELLGIEVPLYVKAKEENDNVMFMGFIDLVFQDTDLDRIIIYDIKTSTRGWSKNDKKDRLKTSQLVLYKQYFAKQYGISVEKIDIKYFIVKRKLIEDCLFPQRRILEFIPPSGKIIMGKLTTNFERFIATCFNSDGTHNINMKYPAIEGAQKYNCKFCEYRERHDLCNPEERQTMCL